MRRTLLLAIALAAALAGCGGGPSRAVRSVDSAFDAFNPAAQKKAGDAAEAPAEQP
jgi:hypothetical protein